LLHAAESNNVVVYGPHELHLSNICEHLTFLETCRKCEAVYELAEYCEVENIFILVAQFVSLHVIGQFLLVYVTAWHLFECQ